VSLRAGLNFTERIEKCLAPAGNRIALYRLSYRNSVQVKVVSVCSDRVTFFQWGRRCRDFPSSLLNRLTGVDKPAFLYHCAELSVVSDLNIYVESYKGLLTFVCTCAGLRLIPY
jgi:hypothetical protein